MKADGNKADPIRIVDANGEPWDGRLIGNGSIVDVKFVVKDYGVGKKKGVYIRALRVLELVPYVSQDFAPLDSDDDFFGKVPEDLKLPADLEPQVREELNDDFPE